MGQECEAHFDNVAVFAFDRPILLMGVRARDAMMDSVRCKRWRNF
jgi:hypothetical protein